MPKERGHMMEGHKTDRKARGYAKAVIKAVSKSGRKLAPAYVEALIGAAYFNGHQSGECFQIGQAYPLLYGPRGWRRRAARKSD